MIVSGLFLFSLITCSTLFAQQNLINNGDFEAYSLYGQITAPSYTDYVRVNGPYGVESGH